ncbi:TonB-dependent receptor domain-containing protein [Selenomonas sp. oral taxon 920]|uniref:TonB-dependent receptor domain-containing protein n=1 Tax=Selenomonas sp. oral taxon 920 TaxID=1884263 RepID=UPI000AA36F56|nr:TonB-dependent receptor [Selenomonas sp. oral taxon 920]
MRMTKQRALAAAVALTLSGTAHAVYAEDTQAQKEGYETAPVVVTASGFEEDVRFAPASISVIKADEIARRGYTDLRQVLDMVEGVDTFGATGRFDTPAVSIRGMDDGYTLILVDGVAQVGPGIAGGMMRSFNQLANTSLPAPSQIERIEVVRGPMSTLYGSDAMGGVINIITKKVTDEFHGSVSVGSILETTDDKSNTMKYNFNVAGPITRDKVGMQMRGSYLKRGPSAFGVDKEKRDYDNWNLGTRVTYTPAAGHSYYLDIDRGQNMRDGDFAQRGKMKPPSPPAPPNAHVETKLDGDVAQRFDRMKIVLGAENKVGKEGTWTNTLSFLRNEMHLDADMTGTAKPNILPLRIPIRSQIRNNVKNDFVTFDTKYVTPLGDDHTLAVGARWQREGVDYHLKRTIAPTGWAPPMFANMMRQRSSNDNGSLSRSSWALYGEDTWALTKKLVFTYGLRYDHPEDYDDNLSPRGYLIYMPNRNFTVKGGIATGYKAPTMLQSAPVDIHLNITGEIYRGNTGLKPEKSTTEEIGFYYHNEHDTDAHVTFFHTDFKNKIDLSDAVNVAGIGAVRTYENVGKARIHGIEVGTKFAIAPKVTAGLNWTLLTSQIKSGKNVGQPLRSTPKQAVNLKLDWMPTDATDVWLSAQYRSGMYRSKQAAGIASHYRPFTVLNMGVTHKLRDGLSVQFAVNNLLNRNFDQTSMAADGTKYGDYYDEIDADGIAGGSYISRRSYWLGLTYDF